MLTTSMIDMELLLKKKLTNVDEKPNSIIYIITDTLYWQCVCVCVNLCLYETKNNEIVLT